MKTKFRFRNYLVILAGIIALTALNSCNYMRRVPGGTDRVLVENDEVRNLKRVRLNFFHRNDVERHTPFISSMQKFLREIKADGSANFTVFETIKMTMDSYPVDQNIFIIVDNKPFEITSSQISVNRITQSDQDTRRVLTADSVHVRVVTDVSETVFMENRISYTIDSEISEAILGGSVVRFRYYSGPYMITTHLRQSELRNLKRLIRTAL
jgi:hypothetical protein